MRLYEPCKKDRTVVAFDSKSAVLILSDIKTLGDKQIARHFLIFLIIEADPAASYYNKHCLLTVNTY